jgi:hypothetical protein
LLSRERLPPHQPQIAVLDLDRRDVAVPEAAAAGIEIRQVRGRHVVTRAHHRALLDDGVLDLTQECLRHGFAAGAPGFEVSL